jgi:hypothetical protein
MVGNLTNTHVLTRAVLRHPGSGPPARAPAVKRQLAEIGGAALVAGEDLAQHIHTCTHTDTYTHAHAVTFVAIGNGAPDLSANISAIRSGQVALSAGAFTGAAMFVQCVVASEVCICVHVCMCTLVCVYKVKLGKVYIYGGISIYKGKSLDECNSMYVCVCLCRCSNSCVGSKLSTFPLCKVKGFIHTVLIDSL